MATVSAALTNPRLLSPILGRLRRSSGVRSTRNGSFCLTVVRAAKTAVASASDNVVETLFWFIGFSLLPGGP